MPIIGSEPSVTLEEIIVATDFTPCSDAALNYARAFARRFGAEITIANVVDLSMAAKSDVPALGNNIESVSQRSADNVERAVDELREDGVSANGVSLESRQPALRVVRMAEERGAGLLVVGTHGRRGLQRFLLGSFAHAVIHHAPCPVLTIGPEVAAPADHITGFANVLFATDLEHQTTEKAMIALTFAESSGAHIHLCHVVSQPSRDLTEALSQQFAAEAALQKLVPSGALTWCDADVAVEYGDPAERILFLAQQTNADLIVLGAHRSAAWYSHFGQGIAGAVIGSARCPVLTICTA